MQDQIKTSTEPTPGRCYIATDFGHGSHYNRRHGWSTYETFAATLYAADRHREDADGEPITIHTHIMPAEAGIDLDDLTIDQEMDAEVEAMDEALACVYEEANRDYRLRLPPGGRPSIDLGPIQQERRHAIDLQRQGDR